MIGINAGRNSLFWIFFILEAAGNGTCILKRFEIHANMDKAMEFNGSVDE